MIEQDKKSWNTPAHPAQFDQVRSQDQEVHRLRVGIGSIDKNAEVPTNDGPLFFCRLLAQKIRRLG